VANDSDCNDADAHVNPEVPEICDNSVDDNCDGQIDEGCYVPPADADGDGVTDDVDQCPGTPAGTAVDTSGCPLPPPPPPPVADADGDGVADGVDLCPNTPAGTTVGP